VRSLGCAEGAVANPAQQQRAAGDGHHRRGGGASTRPSRRSRLNVQGETQDEQPREHDRHGRELADVHGRPDTAGGVRGENGGVIVRLPTGVELSDHDIQELSHEQQRGGQAQRRAEPHVGDGAWDGNRFDHAETEELGPETDPWVHRTPTIEVVVIVTTEIDLVLDGGEEVHLQPSDPVIQRRTMPAWRNDGTEPCVAVAFMVRAE
jgi:hypothetical protein